MKNRNAGSHGVDISLHPTLLCDSQKKSRSHASRKCISTTKKKTKKKHDGLERLFLTPSGKESRASNSMAIRLTQTTPAHNNLQTIANNILTHQGINTDIFDTSIGSEPDEFDELVQKVHQKANVSVKDCLQEMFDGCDGCAPVFLNKHFLDASTPIANSEKHFSKIDSSIKETPISRRDTSSFDISEGDLASQFPFCNVSILPSFSSETSVNISFKTPKVARPLFSPAKNLSASSLNNTINNSPTLLLKTPRPEDINGIFEEASQETSDLPEEVKKSLLAGIFCFVDVKTDKENCSDAVAQELVSMGAKVEKSLNKKVTHLIFKDGRPYIYKRAKRLGVAIVSVIWLEVCKRERKMVDPSLYPPSDQEKYNGLLTSLKMPSLKTIQRKLRQNMLRRAGISISSSHSADPKPRANVRNAITIEKDQLVPLGDSNKHCIKKLDFSGDKVERNPDDSMIIISSEDSSLAGSSEKPHERRNSAPGGLVPVSKRKRDDVPNELKKETKKYITIDKMFAKQVRSQAYDYEDKENIPVQIDTCTPNKKRRKLFDPSETLILSDDCTPNSPVSSLPYIIDSTSTSKNSCKTKLTSTKKRMKKLTFKKRPLNDIPNEDEDNISRSSLSLFLDPKESKSNPPKDPPTIVCTSFSLDEMQKAGYIIGRLGLYDLEERVSSRTTHVVSAGPRRTINLLLAIVRGCWLVDKEWLLESEKADRWVDEAEFEMKSFSSAVVECRLERQAFGSRYCMDLFAGVNGLYISKRSNPPRKDLRELVRLCHGHLVSRPAAAIVIGGDARAGDAAPRVKEKWILDSITNNALLPIDKYKMAH